MRFRLFAGVAALAAFVLASGWLLGDDPKKPDDPKVTGRLPAHFKKLGLSDKQTQDIYKIEASYKDKIDALQQQLDDLKKAEHTDIQNVLTDAQKTALKALETGDPTDANPPKDKPAPPDKATTNVPPPPPPDKDKPATPDKDKTPPPAKDKPATDK